jgi:hypothetical protein
MITISYLDVIRGVQNFTPVLKIHTPFCLLFVVQDYFFNFIPGVNGLAGVGCYLHPGN